MFCLTCDKLGVPRPVCVQNDYSLNNRTFDEVPLAPVGLDGFNEEGIEEFKIQSVGCFSYKWRSFKKVC